MKTEETDSELQHVAAVQGLFVKHSSEVRGYVFSLLPRSSEVDDVLQDTFLTITAKAANFELGTNFRAWAMTIARFKVLEHFRKQKHSELLLGHEVVEMLAEDAPESSGDDFQVEALGRCLNELSPKVRRMLEFRYENGMKPEKIAERLGWGANSVYVTLSRARKTLRDCITKQMEGRVIS